ncbi:MAG: alkaline phosphatase D family protein [Alphaproteobacteria bacterium]
MKHYITRRGLLAAGTAGTVAACTSPAPESFTASGKPASGVFAHGIASGDPLANAVIIWTRVTPANPNDGPVEVIWEVDQDSNFKNPAASGKAVASASSNWTVKVDAEGLEPGTDYYYRFQTDIYTSPVGQTRTLPEGSIDKARFAVVSCANWQHGYFNAYDHIARQDHFDALIHLGDYFYEYGADKILGTDLAKMGRLHEPRHEIITLSDYRTRHAQYRGDPSLQAVTAKMPMIAIWDDHESSNDSWSGGAENHQPNEGDWNERKQAAMRAYYEWMPVRDPAPGKPREALFRAFEWGDLLTMTALETRLLARGEPMIIDDHFDLLRSEGGPEKFKAEILNDPTRDMLGDVQLDFVADTLKASKEAGKPWRLIANQVVMGKVMTPDMTPHVDEASMAAIEKEWDGVRGFVEVSKYGLPVYPDSWDGYPVAREKLYSRLKAEGVTDMFVITGDAHEFWVNDLTDSEGTTMGVEVGATSVSSETLASFMGDATADYALLMTQSNPDVRYYNPQNNGYLDLEFRPDRAEARLLAVDNVLSQDYGVFQSAAFTIRPTKTSLKFTKPQGLNLKQRALFNGLA